MLGFQADVDPWTGGADPWATGGGPPRNLAASAIRSAGLVNDSGTVSQNVRSPALQAMPLGSNRNAGEDPWVHSDPWSAFAASPSAVPTRADRPPKNGGPAFKHKWGTSNKVPKGRGGAQVKQKTQIGNWFNAGGGNDNSSRSEPVPLSDPSHGAGRGKHLIMPAHVASTVLANVVGTAAPSIAESLGPAPIAEAIADPSGWDSIWDDADATQNKQPTAVTNGQAQPSSPVAALGLEAHQHSFVGVDGNAPTSAYDCHVPTFAAAAFDVAECKWWTRVWSPAVTSTPSTCLVQMECTFKENYESPGPGDWLPEALKGDIAVIRYENINHCYVESLESLRPGLGWVPKECVELDNIPPYYEFSVSLQGQENDPNFPIGIDWTDHRLLGEFLETVSLTGPSSIQNYNRKIRDVFPRDQLMVGDMIVSANGQKGLRNMTDLLNTWDWQVGPIHIRAVRIASRVLQAVHFHVLTANLQPCAHQAGKSAEQDPIPWQ